MVKFFAIPLTIVLTSFYFFPFEFSFLPGANTKMILAGFGLIWFIINLARQRDARIDKDFMMLSFVAILVSIAGFAATTINDTRDYTYATYIVSMWVWMGGAYFVINTIRLVHGDVNARLVCNYLIAVCVAQCICAMTMDQYPSFKEFVDGFLASEGFMGKVTGRIYGIGASLDVGGMRFAAVLTAIACMVLSSEKVMKRYELILYVMAFFIIAIIGNMIGRTTIIGVGMALLCVLIVPVFMRQNKVSHRNAKNFWPCFFGVFIIVLPFLIWQYRTNAAVYDNLRFAFEGFFSLAEKGYWETNSNEILKNMVVFPDNFKTWVIGDGYIENPKDDPYYTGIITGGYYMNTDIGYLRFIFYFGVIGLALFSSFMLLTGIDCMKRLPSNRLLFAMVLSLNFIVWLKVASDLFLFFALFLCLKPEREREEEEVETDDGEEADAEPGFLGR